MSVQKLKIFKKLKGGEPYSKNPILDSLIKQKLQSQMIIIKDNFNTLIQKQDAKEKQPLTERQHLKRRLSTQNLATITSQKIKQSINFTHQRDHEVTQFIINRQKSSPFLDKLEIESLNLARSNNEELSIKIKQSDRLNYEIFGVKNNKIEQDYHRNLTQKIRQIIPSDVWLPDQPEVQQILTSRTDNMELNPLKLPSTIKLYQSNRPSSHSIEPLKRSKSKTIKKNVSIGDLQSLEITYDPNKYHKSDYTSLQKWLQSTIDHLNKNNLKSLAANKNQLQQTTLHLNKIYSVYMCTLKEMIRLTYIQSSEKGLLLQKVLWSLIRLFEDLIQQQHKINYQQFKQSSKQMKQQRELYESRIQKLQNLLLQKDQSISKFQDTKRNIVMSCLTYKKVNEEMNDEIQVLMKQMKSLHHQNDYLMKNLRKLINQFEKRQIIKIQKNQKYNMYFYLNQKNQIQVVAKVPRQELLQKFFESQMKQTAIHNIEEELAKQISKVDKLQNDLTSFWLKKKNYLQIDKIIEQNFVCDISEIGIQADPNGPNQYVDNFTQFPEQNQQTFEQFLKKQLAQERVTWQQKQIQFKEVSISLKEVYEQARESISILSNQNITLKQTIDQKDHQISYLKRKIEQVEEKVNIFVKKSTILQKEIESLKIQQAKSKEQIKKGVDRYMEEKKKHMFEKQNNNILAQNNFKLKEKYQQSRKQFDQLEEKIKILAPYLQQMMSLAQSSQNAILLKLSSLIELHLNEYVQKDAKVFLTR